MGYAVQKQNILTFLSAFAAYLLSQENIKHLNIADAIKTLVNYYDSNEV